MAVAGVENAAAARLGASVEAAVAAVSECRSQHASLESYTANEPVRFLADLAWSHPARGQVVVSLPFQKLLRAESHEVPNGTPEGLSELFERGVGRDESSHVPIGAKHADEGVVGIGRSRVRGDDVEVSMFAARVDDRDGLPIFLVIKCEERVEVVIVVPGDNVVAEGAEVDGGGRFVALLRAQSVQDLDRLLKPIETDSCGQTTRLLSELCALLAGLEGVGIVRGAPGGCELSCRIGQKEALLRFHDGSGLGVRDADASSKSLRPRRVVQGDPIAEIDGQKLFLVDENFLN